MCFDWLRQHNAASPLFDMALELGLKNKHLYVLRGWNKLQVGNYQQAL